MQSSRQSARFEFLPNHVPMRPARRSTWKGLTRSMAFAGAVCAFSAIAVTAHDLADITPAGQQILHDEIRNYLLSNPGILYEMAEAYEAMQELEASANLSEAIARNYEVLYNDPFSYVGGNPDGDLDIVEFIDYRCGYCRKAHPQVAELLESDGNIRFIVKEFPILGENSVTSALLAMAVLQLAGNEAYKSVNDYLFTETAEVDDRVVARVASIAGIDAEQLMLATSSEELIAKIQENYLLAQELGIEGTPAFLVGTTLIPGHMELADMRNLVEAERNSLN